MSALRASVAAPQRSAFDLLDEWLETPGRTVNRVARLDGRYFVTLAGDEFYTSRTQTTLDSAIRTALSVAYAAGDR